MKLKFGILWIEDNYSEQEESDLRKAAATAGFQLDITNSTDGANLESFADNQNKFHLYDLILLDLNLANEVSGDNLAADVREKFRSTPMLFYSGSVTVSELRLKMAQKTIEGVFCAHRNQFISRAGQMIKDLSNSVNRLSGMRGLAIEVVAQVDQICKEGIIKMANEGLETFAIEFLDDAVVNQSEKNITDFPNIGTLEKKLSSPAADSSKTFRLFREMTKKYIQQIKNRKVQDKLRELRLQTREYSENVLKVRNVLGHALEEKKPDGWSILDKDGSVYMTVADFPTCRDVFINQLTAIGEIRDTVIANSSD